MLFFFQFCFNNTKSSLLKKTENRGGTLSWFYNHVVYIAIIRKTWPHSIHFTGLFIFFYGNLC